MSDSASTKPATSEEDCGIIMPISSASGYGEDHWQVLQDVVTRAIKLAGLNPQPVWLGPSDIIHDRIVGNLAGLPFAVCVVSGLNSNVMLELGMRLAFGKPTVIINDGQQTVPFDIAAIEYVSYSSSLQINLAEKLIEDLSKKLIETQRLVQDKAYKPFIKTFGPIEPGSIGTDSVQVANLLLDRMDQITALFQQRAAPPPNLPSISLEKRYPIITKPEESPESRVYRYSRPFHARMFAERIKDHEFVDRVSLNGVRVHVILQQELGTLFNWLTIDGIATACAGAG